MLPLRLLPRSRLGRVLLRISLVTIVALLLLFVAVVALVQTTVRHIIAEQQAMRQAEIERSIVLRLQIDEETGLRGFTITGNRAFLAPLYDARAHLPAAAARLERDLRADAPSLAPLANREAALNALWFERIARPTLRSRASGQRIALELRGKDLVDRFRAASETINTGLAQRASAEDTAASAAMTRLLGGSTLFGILLAAALLFYAMVQVRLNQEIQSQEGEYQRLRGVVASLQEAFLAEALPEIEGLRFDAAYAPALEESRVGGDWYGVSALPDGRIYFSVGDVAGHGIYAAVTMTRVRQTILSIAMHERDPAMVLARANEVLRLRTETLVTAFCGFIDPFTLEIAYASAGHPPPLLVAGDNDAFFLPVTGAPLGVSPDPGSRTYVRRASPGSTLVLYTDGLIEFDRNVLHGTQRLVEVATAVAREDGSRPAQTIVRRTLGAAQQRDDIAVLVARFPRERANAAAEKMSA